MISPDAEHPDLPLSHWRAFAKQYSPCVIDQVVERDECYLPDWFVPLARGGAVVSKALLRKLEDAHTKLDWEPGNRLPLEPTTLPTRPGIVDDIEQWHNEPDVFECWRQGQYECLVVRRCYNGLWTIECWNAGSPYTDADQVLVHQCGSTPIFARSLEEAKQLAVHSYDSRLRGSNRLRTLGSLRWIRTCPKDYEAVVKIARQRQMDEGGPTSCSPQAASAKARNREALRNTATQIADRNYSGQQLDARIAALLA